MCRLDRRKHHRHLCHPWINLQRRIRVRRTPSPQSPLTPNHRDVKAINDLLVERGLDTPIHVDAASGGFVAPFINPNLLWDFRLPKVVSINVSGHKYGLVYPGVGWVVWRDPEFLPTELIFNINYLGADQASFTLNFSRGASQIIGQYYQLIRLGKKGYRSIMLCVDPPSPEPIHHPLNQTN